MYMLAKNRAEYDREWAAGRQRAALDTQSLIERIQAGAPAALEALNKLSNIHFARAFVALEQTDIRTFRQECYTAGKLHIMAAFDDGHGGQPFKVHSGNYIYILFAALMSGNSTLIGFLQRNVEHIGQSGFKFSGVDGEPYLAQTILLALKGDFSAVAQRCALFLEKPVTKAMQKRLADFQFLQALAGGDIKAMIASLTSLLEPATARRSAQGMLCGWDFCLQPQVLIYLRVAQLHGFVLNIASNIAPRGLALAPMPSEYGEAYPWMADYDLGASFDQQYKWLEKLSA